MIRMPTGIAGPSAAPTFRSRPVFDRGIPIFLEMRDLKAVMPRNLFHENPPIFIWFVSRQDDSIADTTSLSFPGSFIPETPELR
jgi:hypothetical protein